MLNCVFLCLAYPKGKRYNGPLNNQKKKTKKKALKGKDTEGKTPGFPEKPLQTTQRAHKDTANKNGLKAQSISGSTQASEGETNTRMSVSTEWVVVCMYTLIGHIYVNMFPYCDNVKFFFLHVGGNEESKFSTVDILRKRLHEKIEESRGQVCKILLVNTNSYYFCSVIYIIIIIIITSVFDLKGRFSLDWLVELKKNLNKINLIGIVIVQ